MGVVQPTAQFPVSSTVHRHHCHSITRAPTLQHGAPEPALVFLGRCRLVAPHLSHNCLEHLLYVFPAECTRLHILGSIPLRDTPGFFHAYLPLALIRLLLSCTILEGVHTRARQPTSATATHHYISLRSTQHNRHVGGVVDLAVQLVEGLQLVQTLARVQCEYKNVCVPLHHPLRAKRLEILNTRHTFHTCHGTRHNMRGQHAAATYVLPCSVKDFKLNCALTHRKRLSIAAWSWKRARAYTHQGMHAQRGCTDELRTRLQWLGPSPTRRSCGQSGG